MKIFDNIKEKYIHKKILSNSDRRDLALLPADQYQKILYICENENESFKDKISKVFPGSHSHHLYIRPIKVDNSIGHNYTVHESDFNLTGKLKNDKLNQLSKMTFDLVIDLSQNSAILNYFIHEIPAKLKVGKIGTKNEFLHDFFVEGNGSDVEFLENIRKQITLLTSNGK